MFVRPSLMNVRTPRKFGTESSCRREERLSCLEGGFSRVDRFVNGDAMQYAREWILNRSNVTRGEQTIESSYLSKPSDWSLEEARHVNIARLSDGPRSQVRHHVALNKSFTVNLEDERQEISGRQTRIRLHRVAWPAESEFDRWVSLFWSMGEQRESLAFVFFILFFSPYRFIPFETFRLCKKFVFISRFLSNNSHSIIRFEQCSMTQWHR